MTLVRTECTPELMGPYIYMQKFAMRFEGSTISCQRHVSVMVAVSLRIFATGLTHSVRMGSGVCFCVVCGHDFFAS